MIDVYIDNKRADSSRSQAIRIAIEDEDGAVTGHKVYIFREDIGTFSTLVKEFTGAPTTDADSLVTEITALFTKMKEVDDLIDA